MERTKTVRTLIYVIIITLAFIAAVIFGAYQRARAVEYREDIRMNYQRVFTELVQYVDDLEVSLEKSMFVNDPGQMIRLSGEIYRQAAEAKANLAQLPLSTKPLENVSEFLSQSGDYAYSLSLRMLEGQSMTDEEYKNLAALSGYAKKVAAALDADMEKLNGGTLELSRAAGDMKNSPLDTAMGEIEEQLHDYPALIYDGPFSSHLNDRKPVFTADMPEISKEEALQKAKDLTGMEKLELNEEGGVLPVYYLTGSDGEKTASMAFTKKGGYLEYYLVDRETGDIHVDVAEARLNASKFLESAGFKGMTESYYEAISSAVVINFAAEQDGYTLYPDLVKVKVALDTGEIIGLESRGYIMYHKTRSIPKEKITINDAREKINPNVSIKSITRAVIPMDDGSERFTWQVEGAIGERRCLIYINTQNGAEEKLFLLMESDTGVLAV